MQLARLDYWVATVVTYLDQRKTRAGQRPEMYTETFRKGMSEVANQLIGQACSFVQIVEPEELELSSIITERDSKEDR